MCTVLLPPGFNPIAVNRYININPQCTPLWYACSRIRGSGPVPRDITSVPSKDKVLNCLVAPCLKRRWAGPLSIATMFVSRTHDSKSIHVLRAYAQHLRVLLESQHTHGLCLNISLIFLSGRQTLSIRISHSFVRGLERRRVSLGTQRKYCSQWAVCVAYSHGETNKRVFRVEQDRHFCSIATSDKRDLALTWRHFLSSGYNGTRWTCNIHSTLHNYKVWKYL
jgi:hypothetical protein